MRECFRMYVSGHLFSLIATILVVKYKQITMLSIYLPYGSLSMCGYRLNIYCWRVYSKKLRTYVRLFWLFLKLGVDFNYFRRL